MLRSTELVVAHGHLWPWGIVARTRPCDSSLLASAPPPQLARPHVASELVDAEASPPPRRTSSVLLRVGSSSWMPPRPVLRSTDQLALPPAGAPRAALHRPAPDGGARGRGAAAGLLGMGRRPAGGAGGALQVRLRRCGAGPSARVRGRTGATSSEKQVMDYDSLPHFCKREGSGSSRDSLNGVDCYSYDHPFHQQLYNYVKQQSLKLDSVGPIKQGSLHVDVPSPGLEEVKIVESIESEVHKLRGGNFLSRSFNRIKIEGP